MRASFLLVAGSLLLILAVVVIKGLPGLNWQMISQTPKGGFSLGREGGILNAIVGSLYLAGGGTLLALLLGLPIALYLGVYARGRWADFVRLSLDVMWGTPSIVYGAFGLTLMLALGLRASLLAGIVVLVTHVLRQARRLADHVIFMYLGDLVESGPAEKVFNHPQEARTRAYLASAF